MEVKTLRELLDALIAQAGSERKLAIKFGISNTAVNGWRVGMSYPGDEAILQIAELSKLHPAYVAALVEQARAKTPQIRSMWQSVAEKFKDAAVLAAMCIGAASFGVPSPAQAGFNNTQIVPVANTHCARNKRNKKAARRWFDV